MKDYWILLLFLNWYVHTWSHLIMIVCIDFVKAYF
jgi:hypothetical protein